MATHAWWYVGRNYNYGPAGKALGFDGLRNPEIVSNNSVVAFKTALWFWMTEQKPKPSCHNVMVGRYTPTEADVKANRTAGFGLLTNIINGGLECGIPNDSRVNDRIGFFKRYASLFNVNTGPNLDCENQKSFNWEFRNFLSNCTIMVQILYCRDLFLLVMCFGNQKILYGILCFV